MYITISFSKLVSRGLSFVHTRKQRQTTFSDYKQIVLWQWLLWHTFCTVGLIIFINLDDSTYYFEYFLANLWAIMYYCDYYVRNIIHTRPFFLVPSLAHGNIRLRLFLATIRINAFKRHRLLNWKFKFMCLTCMAFFFMPPPLESMFLKVTWLFNRHRYGFMGQIYGSLIWPQSVKLLVCIYIKILL